MAASKDKRTKAQILKLLSKALENEEQLAKKIATLEADLAACKKKAENPRQELTDVALPASKVSFRIDYYRTSKNSPQKGIIEHLPSRQHRAFEGEGKEIIGHFIGQYLSKTPMKDKEETTTEVSAPKAPAPAGKTKTGSAKSSKREALVAEMKALSAAQPPGGSHLASRLKEQIEVEIRTGRISEPPAEAAPAAQQTTRGQTEAGRSRLLHRLMSELPDMEEGGV